MSILSSIVDAVSSVATGAKDKVVQLGTNFKRSTEDFIGDIVIKSAVNRLKEGALNALSSEQAPIESGDSPSSPMVGPEDDSSPSSNTKKQAAAIGAAIGSTGLMQKLMGNLGITPEQGGEILSKQFSGVIDSVTKEVSKAATDAVRKKVENIQPKDVMEGLTSMLNVDPEATGDVSSSFKLDSAIQIIGFILAAIGMLMIASNVDLSAPKAKEIDISPDDESVSFSPSIH